MKKTIKLLLLAALAWPSLALAQGQPQALPVDKPKVLEHAGDASKLRQHESCTHDMKATKLEDINANASGPDATPGRSNAPRKQPERTAKNITVADGTVENAYIPINGWYYDNYNSTTTRTQMIYPASMLTNIRGRKIRQIRFYANSSNILFAKGTITAKIGTTTSDYFNNTNFKTVNNAVEATAHPAKNDTYLTFVFSTPLVYTGEDNLIIDLQVTTAGTATDNAGDTKFVGATQSS